MLEPLLRDGAWQAFCAAITLFALSFLGVAISLWPMIVPGQFTLWEAASPESTQAFLLVGTPVLQLRHGAFMNVRHKKDAVASPE